MTDLRTAAQQVLKALKGYRRELGDQQPCDAEQALEAALAEPDDEPTYCPTCGEEDGGTTCGMPDCGLRCGAEPVQEPVECEPQYANEDGWCEWVCPVPVGYLMQCCDCGLIHEVESRVAKYQPRPSEEFEVVDDPDLQAQWRMKRRDDISPKQAPQRLAEPVQESQGCDHCEHPLYAGTRETLRLVDELSLCAELKREYQEQFAQAAVQRDALLEALRELLADAEFLGWDTAKARAAIKQAEENT